MTRDLSTQRSAFITVLAWTFIILAGSATFLSIMQNIMFSQMFSPPSPRQALIEQNGLQDTPIIVRLIFRHFSIYICSILLAFATTLVSAIGLLKRKNWARRLSIGLIALAICATLMGFGLQFIFDPLFQGLPPEEIPPEFTSMMNMMKMVMFIVTFTTTSCLVWLILKLTSPKIKQEFICA